MDFQNVKILLGLIVNRLQNLFLVIREFKGNN